MEATIKAALENMYMFGGNPRPDPRYKQYLDNMVQVILKAVDKKLPAMDELSDGALFILIDAVQTMICDGRFQDNPAGRIGQQAQDDAWGILKETAAERGKNTEEIVSENDHIYDGPGWEFD